MTVRSWGLEQALKGWRTKDPRTFLLGLGILGWLWLRSSGSSRQKIYSITLEPGKEVTIKTLPRNDQGR